MFAINAALSVVAASVASRAISVSEPRSFSRSDTLSASSPP